MVSVEQIKIIYPTAKTSDISIYLAEMNKSMANYGINTRLRVCMFITQLLHESAGFSMMRENMNYSALGLIATFPKYFNRASAAVHERDPVGIASIVYANRLGNGPESSLDGWKYRGGGGFGLTFKDNYAEFSKECSLDLVSKPELITNPDIAMSSCGWFWRKNNLNATADTGNLKGNTKILNGGFNGLPDRTKVYERAIATILS